MLERAQFIGRLAGATQFVFAVILGVVASLHFEPSAVSRGTAIVATFALPGIVGLIGTASRRPALLLAAGLTSGVGSVIAFSGVTLIFLAPATMFLFAAVEMVAASVARGTSTRGGWIGGVARLGLASAIVVLVVGAGASALLVTDSACWTTTPTPLGLRIDTTPYTDGPIEIRDVGVSVECATGLISLRGAGLGALLGASAVGLALLAARRRDLPASRLAGA